MKRMRDCLLLIAGCGLIPTTAVAAEPVITYQDHVSPILRRHCFKCHGNDQRKADLNLQTYASLLKGSSGGEVVTAGRSGSSAIYQAITHDENASAMPPNSPKIPAEQSAVIRAWIEQGLRETVDGKTRGPKRLPVEFHPSPGNQPDGPPPMPENLPEVKLSQTHRRLPVVAMAASPWAPLLAVAGYEHVRLVNQQLKPVGVLPFPDGVPHVVRFSRDGAILLAAGGKPVQSGKVVLFDVHSGKRLTEIGDELDAILAADLSPDQSLVAIGGTNRVVKVFRTRDGEPVYKLTKHTDWITSLQFSPDGKRLATADRAGGVHLWEAPTGGISLSLLEHKAAVTSLDWRPDSRMLATGGEDGRLIWWDTTDGWPAVSKAGPHSPQRQPGAYGQLANGVLDVHFAADGRLVTTGRDNTLRLWDASGNQVRTATVDKARPLSVVAMSDGKTFVAGDTSGRLHSWDGGSGGVQTQEAKETGHSDTPPPSPSEVSFRRDVMPVLFRAGCNQGTCHGSSRGKDGFRLSLFGFDPQGDYFRLVEDMAARRINLAVPEQSLMLLKATGSVPHSGGQRFTADSPYYRTLKQWIEAGATPDVADVARPVEITLSPESLLFNGSKDSAQTKVTARYSDGTTRDVTHLALFFSNNPDTVTIDTAGRVVPGQRGDTFVFARFDRFTIGSEVIVLPTDSQYEWSNPPVHNFIDAAVYDRLQKLHVLPSRLADDSSFLRRVYLDLSGRPPTVDEYNSFMNSERDRNVLIDRLLASEDFADVWAGLWGEAVRLKGGGYTPTATDMKAAEAYYQWIRQQFLDNRPLDEFVREQITATGSNLTHGPSNLYTMLVHDVRFKPKNFAADFAQLFTGVQIQCAECHNHPFDRWTMDDYYGFVSFFTGIKRKRGAEPREFYIYNDLAGAPSRHLVDGRPMSATVLGGSEPADPEQDGRVVLANWLTSADNELFSRNLANRIWAHFFGRGLVEPVDDMRISNPPTNKPLLDALAKRLVDSGFDLRALVRDICRSRVYQLSVEPNETNGQDTRQFSRSRLRRLRADVLLDTVTTATGWKRGYAYFPLGTKAIQHYPITPGDTTGSTFGDPFFETFGRSPRASVCACETKSEPTLSQTLHMIVGDTTRASVGSGLITQLIAADRTPVQIIEELYIRCLTRKPSDQERAGMLELVGDQRKDRAVYEDILWSLLNSTEFAFNH